MNNCERPDICGNITDVKMFQERNWHGYELILPGERNITANRIRRNVFLVCTRRMRTTVLLIFQSLFAFVITFVDSPAGQDIDVVGHNCGVRERPCCYLVSGSHTINTHPAPRGPRFNYRPIVSLCIPSRLVTINIATI